MALKVPLSSVEITLTTNRVISRFNAQYMKKEGPTDVLSFPQISSLKKQRGNPKLFNGQFLGDILISLDKAQQQANEQGVSLVKEVHFLVIHSLLHLLGYDHASKKESLEMQSKEVELLRTLYKLKS